MTEITFVTGGARSGKSRYALEKTVSARRKVFIATAEVTDDEMRHRIALHRAERGDAFVTIEEPLDLADALKRIPADTDIAVVDCLTVWLGNLMYRRPCEDDEYPAVQVFLDALQNPPCSMVIVSNEVGMGLVPETPLGRRFRDVAGRVNQAVAYLSHNAVFMVSGMPIQTKGKNE